MTKRHSSGHRPYYSYEQKLHAIRLVREQGLSIISVCKDLNISKSALSNWLKQHDAGSLGSVLAESAQLRPSSSVFESLSGAISN